MVPVEAVAIDAYALRMREPVSVSHEAILQLGESVLACLEALADPHADTITPTLELTKAATAVLQESAPVPPGRGLRLVVDELRAA